MLGSTRCPRCAKHLPADSAFCRRCGRDLRAPHGLAGAAAPMASLPRRAVPVPQPQRGNGRLATLAFALFALLFVVGLLFSTRSPMGAKPRAAPVPETSVEDQGEWNGDHHGESAEPAPQRQDSRRPQW